jgi:hypothetical protein
MAFELIVSCKQPVPEDLRERWPRLLKRHEIDCEIDPSFSPANWQGGFLPFKVISIPRKLIDADLESPAISGFEVDFDANRAFLRSAMGRTCTEFALLCLCAAELAIATDGQYHDPQSGQSYSGDGAREAALAEIEATLNFDGAADRIQHPFDGWH